MTLSRHQRWALAAWAFNVLDWALTKIVIDSGLGDEANPLLAGWITGPGGFALKTAGVGVLLALLARYADAGSRLAARGLVGITLVYGAVVWYTAGKPSWTSRGATRPSRRTTLGARTTPRRRQG